MNFFWNIKDYLHAYRLCLELRSSYEMVTRPIIIHSISVVRFFAEGLLMQRLLVKVESVEPSLSFVVWTEYPYYGWEALLSSCWSMMSFVWTRRQCEMSNASAAFDLESSIDLCVT